MDDLKNNRAPLLCYFKLCASFQSHRWIQTGVTVRKRSIWIKIGNFYIPCDLEIWWMTLKNKRAPLLCCFKLYASFHSHRWIQTKVTVRKRSIRVKIGDFFVPCDLEIWWMTLKNNRAPLLCCFKLYTSFHSHWWIPTKVTVRTLKNNRAPLLSLIKLCASFHQHMFIQTEVTVRKHLSWVMTSVTLTYDLDLLHAHNFCHW